MNVASRVVDSDDLQQIPNGPNNKQSGSDFSSSSVRRV